MKTKMNFMELLDKHVIEVPSIQRDFAFGRDDKVTEGKRNKFINDLKSVLTGADEQTIHLDFIYGKKDLNDIFIPLDGQQRLTILYLLHIYVYNLTDNINSHRDNLKKFTYKTRISSRDFCSELVNNNLFDNELQKNLSSSLTDQEWFFNSWKSDPTIVGMLTMLDTIHEQLKDSVKTLDKNKLDNITFSFLNIEALGSPEELYIKMNSRGKPLSKWDDLKAEMSQQLCDSDNRKLDNELVDDFYKMLEYFRALNHSNKIEISVKNLEHFMWRFFNIIIKVEELIKSRETSDETTPPGDNQLKDLVQKGFKMIELIKLVMDKGHDTQFEYLSDEDGLKLNKLLQHIFSYDGKANDFGSYSELELFNIYLSYSLNEKKLEQLKHGSYEDFAQLIRFYNNKNEQYLFDETHSVPALKFMKDMILNEKCTLKYLNTFYIDKKAPSLGSNILQSHILDEILKAHLIVTHNEWEEEIYHAETHEYLNGNIGFIIALAGENLEKFKKYYQNFQSELYEKCIISREKRVDLMKIGDIRINSHLPHYGRTGQSVKRYNSNNDKEHETGSNILRDKSWLYVFRSITHWYYFKNICETSKKASEDGAKFYRILCKFLNEYDEIYNESYDISEINDWRYWFINVPEMINKIGMLKVGQNDRLYGTRWQKQSFSATKYELPLLALSLLLKKDLNKEVSSVEYEGFSSRWRDVSYITYELRDGTKYNIHYDYKNNQYELYKNEEEVVVKQIKVEFKNSLKSQIKSQLGKLK